MCARAHGSVPLRYVVIYKTRNYYDELDADAVVAENLPRNVADAGAVMCGLSVWLVE